MTIEKTLTGWLVISDVVKGHLVTEKYQGYTRREAKRLFKQKHLSNGKAS